MSGVCTYLNMPTIYCCMCCASHHLHPNPTHPPPPPTGVWLCVHAYGKTDVNVTMRAQLTQCPSTFFPEGLQQCSSPGTVPTPEGRYDQCTDDGRCVCRGEWARPTNTTGRDLGFEDCSARVVQLPKERFVEGHGRRAEIGNQVWRGGGFCVGGTEGLQHNTQRACICPDNQMFLFSCVVLNALFIKCASHNVFYPPTTFSIVTLVLGCFMHSM